MDSLGIQSSEKNNLNIKQTAKEWACTECTKRSTIFLEELRKLVVRMMHSMSILVALTIFSLIANSLALGVVVQLAKALEDNICCPSL